MTKDKLLSELKIIVEDFAWTRTGDLDRTADIYDRLEALVARAVMGR